MKALETTAEPANHFTMKWRKTLAAFLSSFRSSLKDSRDLKMHPFLSPKHKGTPSSVDFICNDRLSFQFLRQA